MSDGSMCRRKLDSFSSRVRAMEWLRSVQRRVRGSRRLDPWLRQLFVSALLTLPRTRLGLQTRGFNSEQQRLDRRRASHWTRDHR